jgi:flagellar biosynthesis protein FlhG
LLVDCDLGLANADVLLGVNPTTTLFDVVFDQTPIGAAVINHPSGIGFIPAASGREELTALNPRQFRGILDELARVARGYDLLVLDTAAGIQREVTHLLRAATASLVVLTPDPTSLTDAYALIKVLEQQEAGRDLRILVNQVRDQQEALQVFAKIRKVAQTYLHRDLSFAGYMPRDRAVQDAVRKRRPFAKDADSPAAQALLAAATRLRGIDWK